MQKIIINNVSGNTATTKPHALNEVQMGSHFNAFVESQKQGPKEDGSYKYKGITSQGAATSVKKRCIFFHIAIHTTL